MKKSITVVLVLAALLGMTVMPVNSSLAYSEDPLAEKDFSEFGSPLEETEPTDAAAEETAEADSEADAKETEEAVAEENAEA